MKCYLFFVLFVIGFTVSYAQSHEERRIALVIGNSDYEYHGNLRTSENDAKEIYCLLDSLSFKVLIKTNLNYANMDKMIESFCRKAKGYDVALFYFTGLGLRFNHQDFIIPIGANVRSSENVLKECISVDYIMNKMRESGIRLRLGFYDICRRSIPIVRHKGINKGIVVAPMMEGELRIFSSSPEELAFDQLGIDSPHSPFCDAITWAFQRKPTSWYDFLDKITDYVYKETDGRQNVYVEGTLKGHYSFDKKLDIKKEP